MSAQTMFDVMTGIALVVQVVAAALCVARIATSDNVASRIVALDLLLAVVLGGVAILSARADQTAYVDVVVVGALVTFIGSVVAARLLDGEGA